GPDAAGTAAALRPAFTAREEARPAATHVPRAFRFPITSPCHHKPVSIAGPKRLGLDFPRQIRKMQAVTRPRNGMRPAIGGQLSVSGWFLGSRGSPFSLVPAAIVAAARLAAQTPEQKPFDEWLVELRSDALKAGISEKTLDAALADVAP